MFSISDVCKTKAAITLKLSREICLIGGWTFLLWDT
jgi:hypothetical protein